MKKVQWARGARGFTLLEMLVVVGIMGIIALMMSSFFAHYQTRTDYNQKRLAMLGQLETLQNYIKRDVAQLDMRNKWIVLTDQAGHACTSNCPGLRFHIAKAGVGTGDVSYATLCVQDVEGAINPKDLSKTLATCVRCGNGMHAALMMVSGGKSTMIDLTRTNTGKQDRYSAGGSICMSLGSDALLFHLTMGLVDDAGNVKPLEKELYLPLQKAEGLQLLGR